MHSFAKCMLAAVAAVLSMNCAAGKAQDTFDFFHPLLGRRPVMEQQIEIQGARWDSAAGNDAAATIAVDYHLLPRLQIESTLPLLWLKPRGVQSQSGIGDIEFEAKSLILASNHGRTMFAAGLDATFPSGNPAKGLGGNTALNPFLTAGTHFRNLELLADFGYIRRLRGPDVPQQLADGGVAAGFRVLPLIVPFVELRAQTGSSINAEPGVQINLPWGPSLLFGVEKPLTRERDFNTPFRAGLVWDLPSRK